MADVSRLKNKFEAKPKGPMPISAPRSTPAGYEQRMKEQNKLYKNGNGVGQLQKKIQFKYQVAIPSAPATALRSTPASFEQRKKELTQKEKDAKKKALQQAARVNLTLRALDLGKSRQVRDTKAQQATKFSPAVSSSSAPRMPTSVSSWSKPEESKMTAPSSSTMKSGWHDYDVVDNSWQDDGGGNIAEEDEEEQEIFHYPEMEEALRTGNEQELNRTVVSSFLEANGRNGAESVRLLEEYRGNEEELMNNLLKEEQERYEKEMEEERDDDDEPPKGYITAARMSRRIPQNDGVSDGGWD